MTTSTTRTPGCPGVTFEQYEAAFRELSGPEGNAPSQRQIRRYLGTGSNSTLSAYRRRIAEQRSEQAVAPESGTPDEKLLTTVTLLVSQLSLDAAQVADDRVDEIQAEADQRIRIAETTMEKRPQDTALLEHRATTAEATVAEQHKSLIAKDETRIQIEADLQVSRESVATLTPSLEGATIRLATLTRQHDALQLTLDQTRTDNDTALEQHQEEIDSVEHALSDSKTALATSMETCASVTTRLEERDRLIDTHNTQHQALQQRLDHSSESLVATRLQLEELQQSLSGLKAQLSARDVELRAERQAHQVSTERLRLALKAVADKEVLTRKLQEALTKLATGTDDKS